MMTDAERNARVAALKQALKEAKRGPKTEADDARLAAAEAKRQARAAKRKP